MANVWSPEVIAEIQSRFAIKRGKCHRENGVRVWDSPGGIVYRRNIITGKYNYPKGSPAGNLTNTGYILVSFRLNGKQLHIFTHRIVWLLTHPDFDMTLDIDHINHDTANNDIRNLRAVSTSSNCSNKSAAQRNSKLGLLGVSWYASRNKYAVSIVVKHRKYHLGYFTHPHDAVRCFWKFKRKHEPELTEQWLIVEAAQLRIADNLMDFRAANVTPKHSYARSGKYTNEMKAARKERTADRKRRKGRNEH